MSDCYIGRTACGCVVAAVVIECRNDNPEAAVKWRRSVAKDVADWVRRGYTVEKVPVEYVRENLNFCSHKAPKRRDTQAELALTALPGSPAPGGDAEP